MDSKAYNPPRSQVHDHYHPVRGQVERLAAKQVDRSQTEDQGELLGDSATAEAGGLPLRSRPDRSAGAHRQVTWLVS